MPQATPGRTSLRLVVTGQIQSVRSRDSEKGKVFHTLLKTPAVDQYSSPGTFEVRSRARLGSEGAEVTVECDLLGYSRSYKDKDGGAVRTAEHVLQAA